MNALNANAVPNADELGGVEMELVDPNDVAAEEYFAEQRHIEALSRARSRLLISTEELIHKPYVEGRFLIGPKLLPKHGRMLITGMSGTGKSALALYLAACLTTKQPLFGILDTHKGENYGKPKFPILDESVVLYIDYELPDAIRAEERLKPLAAHFPNGLQRNLFFVPHPSFYRLHNLVGEDKGDGSFDKLGDLVRGVCPDVLIVDPLSSAHTLDENSIAIKQALNNVDRLIDLHGCAAIVVHHSSTKSQTTDRGEQIKKPTIAQPRGHSSLVDWCDVHMHFAEGKAEDDGEEGDDAETEKIIEMSFGKTRYCQNVNKRNLQVNFGSMEVTPVVRGGYKKLGE